MARIKEVKIGIIGGSGLYTLLEAEGYRIVETPFGKTPRIEIGYVSDKAVAFLPRHSKPGSLKVSHAVPPSEINYRANIYGLKKLGVERIFTTQAAGSINPNIKPGEFVIVDQVIDMTKRRIPTFFDGKTKIKIFKDKPPISGVVHIDFTNPYCPELREVLKKSCEEEKILYHPKGTYICTEGPRFESPAEIAAYRILGADVVGMTGYPEVALARELGICYASIVMSTNYAAGTGPVKITHEEVKEIFNKNIDNVKRLLTKAVKNIPDERKCECSKSLEGAIA
ncbi:MAG: MTAP family purine nucleoside phosphorylase [Thermoproteota archaeon]